MKFPPFFLSQLCVVGITVLGALQVLATSPEWPQFRGPTGDGVSEAKNLPLRTLRSRTVVSELGI
jgi:hypothetical protein